MLTSMPRVVKFKKVDNEDVYKPIYRFNKRQYGAYYSINVVDRKVKLCQTS